MADLGEEKEHGVVRATEALWSVLINHIGGSLGVAIMFLSLRHEPPQWIAQYKPYAIFLSAFLMSWWINQLVRVLPARRQRDLWKKKHADDLRDMADLATTYKFMNDEHEKSRKVMYERIQRMIVSHGRDWEEHGKMFFSLRIWISQQREAVASDIAGNADLDRERKLAWFDADGKLKP